MRSSLPDRRFTCTYELYVQNKPVTFSTGHYHDGRLGEVFIEAGKAGSDVDSTARDSAVLASIALQHGISIEALTRSLTRNPDGSPSSLVGAVLDAVRHQTQGQS